jgi:hypothetical protein
VALEGRANELQAEAIVKAKNKRARQLVAKPDAGRARAAGGRMSAGTAVRLYEVADDFIRAVAELTERDDLPADVINDTLAAVKGDLEVKATNVAAFARNVEIEAEALAQRAKDMAARAKRARTLADGMRAYLARELLRCDMKEVTHDGMRIALAKNPPAVEIVDVEQGARGVQDARPRRRPPSPTRPRSARR